MSVTTDDGYMVSPHRRAATLTTIPGQPSRERASAMNQLFGPQTRLDGVIFVASYGYSEIWQRNIDVVANNLSPYDIRSLLEWNRRQEVDNFSEVCNRIVDKHELTDGNGGPRWLLVLANKADLYWPTIAAAESYYRRGSSTDFDQHAQRMLSQLGSLAIDYRVLPVATQALDFRFGSSRGLITAQTQLTNDQCDASLLCLVETIGELCNG